MQVAHEKRFRYQSYRKSGSFLWSRKHKVYMYKSTVVIVLMKHRIANFLERFNSQHPATRLALFKKSPPLWSLVKHKDRSWKFTFFTHTETKRSSKATKYIPCQINWWSIFDDFASFFEQKTIRVGATSQVHVTQK